MYTINQEKKAELIHVGILGMKWGRRKSSSRSNDNGRALSNKTREFSRRKLSEFMEKHNKKKIKMKPWTPKQQIVFGLVLTAVGGIAYRSFLNSIGSNNSRFSSRAPNVINPNITYRIIRDNFLTG